MTDLTDKWKKGELPEGWYYVKGNRAESIYAYTAEYLNNMYRPRNGEKIIEQVPSYEEWQAKLEENAQLKELLKEWVQFEIEENPLDFTVMSERMSGLANKTKRILK